jgi:hypothetical protein
VGEQVDLDARVGERVGHALVLSRGLCGRHGCVEQVRLGVERTRPEFEAGSVGTNVSQAVELGAGGERWHLLPRSVDSGAMNPSPVVGDPCQRTTRWRYTFARGKPPTSRCLRQHPAGSARPVDAFRDGAETRLVLRSVDAAELPDTAAVTGVTDATQ